MLCGGSLDLRVRRHHGRDRRGVPHRGRGRALRVLGYQPIPPELRENLGELEAARRGELPELVGYGDLRGDLHRTRLVDRRQELDRGDGPGGRRAATSTSPSPTTRTTSARAGSAQLEEIEALAQRFRRSRSCAASRRTSAPRRGRRAGGAALLDWVVASLHTRPTTARPSGCWRRWTTRTSTDRPPHRAQDQHARPARRRRRARDRARARDGHVPRDQRAARPARPLATSRPRRGRRAAALVDRRAPDPRARYIELGIGQARRGWLTRDDVLNTRPWARCEKLRRKRP